MSPAIRMGFFFLAPALGFLCCGGSRNGPPAPDGCPFPFRPPERHVLKNELGLDVEVWDLQVLCSLEHAATRAEVFLQAEPTGTEFFNIYYQATAAYVCVEGEVTRLPDGMFYYEARHHGWDAMEVAFDGLRYVYGWSEVCVGYRPCTDAFDVLDVLRLQDGAPVAQGLPTTCVRLTADGNPRPLVPMVRVPADGDEITFPMGSMDGDPDEQPVHPVTLKPFRLDVREATNSDFALFLNDHGNDCAGSPCLDEAGDGLRLHRETGGWKPEPGHDDTPVVQVDWHGAQAYCEWRSWLELPTEAQWELAASAGGGRTYPWGSQAPTCQTAAFDACGAAGPLPACSLPAGHSREGVCDLAGNLAEWVADGYAADYYASCAAGCSEPTGPAQAVARVVRGGSFADPAGNLRAADRGFAEPQVHLDRIGVRCARWTFPQNQ